MGNRLNCRFTRYSDHVTERDRSSDRPLVDHERRPSEPAPDGAATGRELPTRLLREATAPAFAELRNIVTGLTSYLAAARIIALDLEEPLWVLEQVARGVPHPLEGLRLAGDIHWRDDLNDLVGSLASTVARMQRALLSLEHSLDAVGEEQCPLDETLDIASTIADHAVRSVGGVRWSNVPAQLHLDAPRFSVSLTVALLLRVLAEHARRDYCGIDGHVEVLDDAVELRLSVQGASREAYRSTVLAVGRTVEDAALQSLQDADDGVRARWTRARMNTGLESGSAENQGDRDIR